jgi:protein-S-isoprenylcysteine O-methyltransferase Ste14
VGPSPRTGRTPLRHGGGVNGWAAILALSLAFVAGPLAELLLGAQRLIHGTGLAVASLALSFLALLALLWSQSSMGDSLRIGVDLDERTDLITAGPFQWVRNPIFSCMILYLAGVFLLVPNLAAVLALAALTIGIDLHVRLVEEPCLIATHGFSYLSYAARVGRFAPGVGRLGVGAAG